MKITRHSKSPAMRELQDLEPGTVFAMEMGAELWMKCHENGLCVRLSDGYIAQRGEHFKVLVVDAHLVVEGSYE